MRRDRRVTAVGRQRATRAAATGPDMQPWRMLPSPALLIHTPARTRAGLLTDLQRAAGNAAVCRLLTEPHRQSPSVHGGGPSVSLHGDTTADYDGGVSKWVPKSIKRATGCTECPDDDPCVHAVGTFSVAYHANVTITMPDVPDGLTECQQRRVRAFLRDVLTPHEREHARRFHTYDGTTTHRVDFTGCGMSALQEHLQSIHDTEEAARHSAADSLSAAIDPFNRPIDLDCQD